MERRFLAVYDALADRKTRGEAFADILRNAPSEDLVGALAAAGQTDPVAANAIATELLNRLRRAPFLGTFFVSATVLFAIYALDFVYTGTFLLLDSGARAYLLAGFSAAVALVSAVMLLLAQGRLPSIRMILTARRSRRRSF